MTCRYTVYINSLEDTPYYGMSSMWMKHSRAATSVYITGAREFLEEPKLKFTVHLMQLTAQDLQSLQFDSRTIPSPKFTSRNSYSFKLPLGHSVVYVLLAL